MKKRLILIIIVVLLYCEELFAAKKINSLYCQQCGNDAIVWLESEQQYVCADCFTPHDTKTLMKYSGSYTGSLSFSDDSDMALFDLQIANSKATFRYERNGEEFSGVSNFLNEHNQIVCKYKFANIEIVLKFIEFQQARVMCNLYIDNEEYTYVVISSTAWKYSYFKSTVKNVRTTQNAKFEIPEYQFLKTDDSNVLRIKANPKRGYWFDAYLWIPDDPSTAEINNMHVTCYNPNSCVAYNKTLEIAYQWISEGTNQSKKYLKVPILMLGIPRYFYYWGNEFPEKGFLDVTLIELKSMAIKQKGIYKRIDNQIAAIINDALDYLNKNYTKMASKVLIDGYSATGSFASYFSMLHPELVQAAVAGAASPLLPISEYNGKKLTYPVGIADFEELVGYPFNLKEWQKVHMLYTRGAYDLNNDNPLWDPSLQYKQINKTFKKKFSDCYPEFFEILNEASDHVETIYYPNRSHQEVVFDSLDFLKENCKDEMNFLVSSEDIEIIYNTQNREFIKENSIELISEKEFNPYGKLKLRLPLDNRTKLKIVLNNRIPNSDMQSSSGTLDCRSFNANGDKVTASFSDNLGQCHVDIEFYKTDISKNTLKILVVVNNSTPESVVFRSQLKDIDKESICWSNNSNEDNRNSNSYDLNKKENLESVLNRMSDIIDNSGSYTFYCPDCHNSGFVYNNKGYHCTNCNAFIHHENIQHLLEGIWVTNIDGKDIYVFFGYYDSPDKYMWDGKRFRHGTCAGNWYHENPRYAILEFIEFDNDCIFFNTIDENNLICELLIDGIVYHNVNFTRADL